MPISFYSFMCTVGIGLPGLGILIWATRRPEGRSWGAHVSIALILALMITPTIISPYRITYVEAAVIVLRCRELPDGAWSPI